VREFGDCFEDTVHNLGGAGGGGGAVNIKNTHVREAFEQGFNGISQSAFFDDFKREPGGESVVQNTLKEVEVEVVRMVFRDG